MFYSQEEDGVSSLALPVRNSLKFNRYVVNPTFSFVREQNKFASLTNKREWVQFEDAPQTYLFSYSGRFAENIGAGVGLFQQNYGVLTTFGGILNFAYNARLSRDNNLTFGLNVGAHNTSLNTGNVVTNFPDPAMDNYPSTFSLTVNPGVNFGTAYLDFGVSINNLVLYATNASEFISQDNQKQSVQAHLMYSGYMESAGFFDESRFSGLVRSEFKNDKTVLSAVAMLMVPKGIWAQVGYNNLYGASGGLGLNITKQIAIEYNFEKALGDLTDFGPSHEITLAYKFNNRENYDYSREDDVSGLISGDKPRRPVSKVSKVEAEANRKLAAEAKAEAKLLAEAKSKAEEEAKAQMDAKNKAKAEAQAKAAAEAVRIAKEAEAKLAAEAKIKAEEDLARQERERIAKEVAEAKAKIAAENKAKAESEAQKKAEETLRLEAEAEAKAQREAQAKLAAENKAKEEAEAKAIVEAEARLIAEAEAKAQQEAQAKLAAENKAKEEAEAAEEARLKLEAENALTSNENEIGAPTDAISQSMTTIEKLTENSKKEQEDLLTRFSEAVASKDKDLKDLKEENDLGDQGIYMEPKPFKSVTEENNAIEALKLEIDEIIQTRNEKIKELESLYEERLRIATMENDTVNLYYQKTIKRLKAEQLTAIQTKASLTSTLKDINEATEFERKRRIKRAAYDSEQDRYVQDVARLKIIKQNTPLSDIPLKAEDFDFGKEQSDNIQILKNVRNVGNGYYMILAVHDDVEKRDDFLKKAVASGRTDIDFFYDVNTSKYYIYHQKFESVDQANEALKSKGDRPYNGQLSIVKIEN